MRTVDVIVVGVWAAAGFALGLAVFQPFIADAVVPGKAGIEVPKLLSGGVEFTLQRVGEEAFKAGDKPSFELRAKNTTDKEVQVNLEIGMTCMSPVNFASRMEPRPELLWRQEQLVKVKAGGSATVTLKSDTALPKGKEITLHFRQATPAQADAAAPTTRPADLAKAKLALMNRLLEGTTAMTFSTGGRIVAGGQGAGDFNSYFAQVVQEQQEQQVQTVNVAQAATPKAR